MGCVLGRHSLACRSTVAIGFALFVALAVPGDAGADQDGATLYRVHCATCHGVEGLGNGPLAPAMRVKPPDLTQLARRNNGIFPEARVRRVVDGREVESHGSRDMPVWGDIFKTAGELAADVAARIAAIVRHLESLQQRDAQ